MVRVFLHTLSPEMPRTLTSLDTDILSIPGASVRSVQGSREKGRGLGFRVYAKVPALRLRFGKYGVKDNILVSKKRVLKSNGRGNTTDKSGLR